MRHQVSWHPSRGTRRLATIALLALAAALITGHAGLLLLAAPLLAALAAAPRARRPDEVRITAATSARRCFEREDIELRVTVTAAGPMEEIAFRLELPAQFGLVTGSAAQVTLDAATAQADWTVRPAVWGRYRIGPVHVSCHSRGGTWSTAVEARTEPIDVYPRPPAVRPRLVPPELLRRIGEHAGRAAGEGIEFAGVRGYLPGDRLRDVNWMITSRRGALHVNQRTAQRATDLVVMVNAFSEIGPPGETTLDAAVRGAAALATAYLRTGDRAGIVTLGGMLRWLGPAPGQRQFYRIAEMVLGARFASDVTPDLDRIPRTALPPGALVIFFSPLLDKRALGALADLRERGFPLVVVDVLRREPPALARSRMSELALRNLAAGPGGAAVQAGQRRDPGDHLALRSGARRRHGSGQAGAGRREAAMMRLATALAGVVLVLVPVAAEPAWAYPVAVAGLGCALVTLWPRHGASAARRVRAAIMHGQVADRGDPAAGGRTAAAGGRAGPAAGTAGRSIAPGRAAGGIRPGGIRPGGTRTAACGRRPVWRPRSPPSPGARCHGWTPPRWRARDCCCSVSCCCSAGRPAWPAAPSGPGCGCGCRPCWPPSP